MVRRSLVFDDGIGDGELRIDLGGRLHALLRQRLTVCDAATEPAVIKKITL